LQIKGLKRWVIKTLKAADNRGRGHQSGSGLSLKTGPRKGEANMARKRKPRYRVPEKSAWHLYSLQNLNSEKFIQVVNKILRREYLVIK
jgi:hypothetical protein